MRKKEFIFLSPSLYVMIASFVIQAITFIWKNRDKNGGRKKTHLNLLGHKARLAEQIEAFFLLVYYYSEYSQSCLTTAFAPSKKVSAKIYLFTSITLQPATL